MPQGQLDSDQQIVLVGHRIAHADPFAAAHRADNVLEPKIVSHRVPAVATETNGMYQSCGRLHCASDLFKLVVPAVHANAQQVEQRAIAERVAIFAQQIVTAWLKMRSQNMGHRVPIGRRMSHMHMTSLSVAWHVRMARPVRRILFDAMVRKEILNVTDHDRGVVGLETQHLTSQWCDYQSNDWLLLRC